MPSQAEAVTGVRFQVQDVSATEKARRILEAITLKEEILEATRRTKVHTSMLEYTRHAQRLKQNRINLDKLRQRTYRGLVSYPVMQFDNTLALSGFPPSTLQPPSNFTQQTTSPNDRAPIRTYNQSHTKLQPVKHWVPDSTLNHFSVTPQTEICQQKARKIAILKSNDEILYANYNVSGSGAAAGEHTAIGRTAAATESRLDNDVAVGDENPQIRGNHNRVKTVGGAANIKLRQPDTFHPGVLPRPGQGGRRKLTPRFTLDITLPRMELTDEVAAPCPSPCSTDTHDDNDKAGNELVADDEQNEKSNLDGGDGGKPEEQIDRSNDGHVTVASSCPDCLAERGNVIAEQTKARNDTSKVTDPDNSPSTHGKSASNDQTATAHGHRVVTFRSGRKTKEGQHRRYNLRRTRSLIADSNVPDLTFLERYKRCNVTQITLGEDQPSVLQTDAQQNPAVSTLSPTTLQNKASNLANLTLRSILKANSKRSVNEAGDTTQDGTLTESTLISSECLELKREEDFKDKKDPSAHQTTQEDANTLTQIKDISQTNVEFEKVTSVNDETSAPKVKIKDNFANDLNVDSYHKSYSVNTLPLPAHMKRILDNAMESVPKLNREQSLQNVSGKEKRRIDVNQACQILDNISVLTKQRDNGNVCRHGMFLANCSVCKALVEIQQRLKSNIKKHVEDRFHWNLLPRMQLNGKIKWPIKSDSTATSADTANDVDKTSTKLPVLQSTISITEYKRLRRKKRGIKDIKGKKSIPSVKDNKGIPKGETMQVPAVQTITFHDELETEESDELASPRRKKKVTFAERNIYRQMIGYKA